MIIFCGKRKYKFKDEPLRPPSNKDNKKRRRKEISLPLNFRLEMAGMVEEKGMMQADLYKGDREFEPIIRSL